MCAAGGAVLADGEGRAVHVGAHVDVEAVDVDGGAGGVQVQRVQRQRGGRHVPGGGLGLGRTQTRTSSSCTDETFASDLMTFALALTFSLSGISCGAGKREIRCHIGKDRSATDAARPICV